MGQNGERMARDLRRAAPRPASKTRGTCPHCGGRGKVVVVPTQPEVSCRDRSDRVCGLAEADDTAGCAGLRQAVADCGGVRVVDTRA